MFGESREKHEAMKAAVIHDQTVSIMCIVVRWQLYKILRSLPQAFIHPYTLIVNYTHAHKCTYFHACTHIHTEYIYIANIKFVCIFYSLAKRVKVTA